MMMRFFFLFISSIFFVSRGEFVEEEVIEFARKQEGKAVLESNEGSNKKDIKIIDDDVIEEAENVEGINDSNADEDLDALDNEDEDDIFVKSDVLVGTDSNLGGIIEEHDYALIKFYTPHCSHCQALEPEYEEAARILKEKGAKTKLIKVDVSVETELGKRFGIQKYPTIKYLPKTNKLVEYDGGRTAASIATWVAEKEKPLVEDWTTEILKIEDDDEGIRARLLEKKIDFLILGEVVRKSVRHKALIAAADLLRERKLNVTVASRFLDKKKNDPKGELVKLKFFRRYVFGQPGVEVLSEITNWKGHLIADVIQKLMFQKINFLFNGSQKVIFPYPWIFVFQGPEGMDENVFDPVVDVIKSGGKKKVESLGESKLINDLLRVGDDKIATVVVPDPKVDIRKLGIQHVNGRKDKNKATLLMLGPEKNYAKQISVHDLIDGYNFKRFVDEVLVGKYKPDYKTEEDAPEFDAVDEVAILTGANFSEKALDPKKDVFVKFYAPYCGHCKQLAPTWAEFSDTMKKFEGVSIAKFDVTQNECDEEVHGYPKLVLYPAKKNSYRRKIEYTSDKKNLLDLVEFVFENAENLIGESPPHVEVKEETPHENLFHKENTGSSSAGKGNKKTASCGCPHHH